MTTTTRKTISEFLEEGRRVLEETATKERQEQAERDRQHLESWTALRMQAQDDLGELADSLPVTVPDDFTLFCHAHTIKLCPFQAAMMFVRYREGVKNEWLMDAGTDHPCPISVQKEFLPAWDDDGDPPSWYLRPVAWHDTFNVAEAIAVCQRATAAYRKCDAECRRRKPPVPPTKENPPPLDLTEGEIVLVMAIRDLLAERE